MYPICIYVYIYIIYIYTSKPLLFQEYIPGLWQQNCQEIAAFKHYFAAASLTRSQEGHQVTDRRTSTQMWCNSDECLGRGGPHGVGTVGTLVQDSLEP
jgi:hypothetical protein